MKKAFCLFNAVSCATGGVVYGLLTIPLSTVFAWRRVNKLRRRNSHPRFVLGFDSVNKRELSVDAEGLLKIKKSGAKATFEDLVIRWGARPLRIGDALVNSSGCDGGPYYIASHIWENDYRLDDGRRVTLTSPAKEHCNGGGVQGKKVGTIKLNFQKSGGSAASDFMIWIKSCEFNWNSSHNLGIEKKSLKVSCKGNSNANGSTEEIVTLTLDGNTYKS